MCMITEDMANTTPGAMALANRKRRPSSSSSYAAGSMLESTMTEIRLFLELAIPTTLVTAGTNLAPVLIASYVGTRFGVIYLSGYMLANLTGNLCTYSISSGLFSASDTLGPQAFGVGNYREVGLIAARGFVVAHAILLPINAALYFWLQPLLVWLGQDPEAAHYASEWYKVFVFSLPFYILYSCIWKFVSAQHILKPMIVTSLVSCGIILPLGLEILTERFGYLGSAYAYVTFQAAQALLLLGHLCWTQPHHKGTWLAEDADFWQDALLDTPAVGEFVHLGLGGVFAQSEWLFWEALGLLVGLLGVLPLSVHAIPNQVTVALSFGPFMWGIALAVRMGAILPQSVERAQRLAIVACVAMCLFDGALQMVVYYNAGPIISFFTADPDATALAEAIWWKVCVFNFATALFAMLCGVATALGMQWMHGAVNFGFLFLLGLPAIYYLAVIQEGGLETAWTCIILPYVGIDLTLIGLFVTADWHAIQGKIVSQNKLKTVDSDVLALEEDSDSEAQLMPVVGELRGLLSDPEGSPLISYGAR